MILTITLNPAVDIGYQLDDLSIDTVNRIEGASKTAGGKGLNVARVVSQLNEKVAATGFLGGHLGNFIRSEIKAIGIEDYFVQIEGETRNCIAILHDGKQTEILESGPVISPEESETFIEKYKSYLQKVKIVAISGSLPKGLHADFYIHLIEIANNYLKPVLLDVNGSLLKEILVSEHKPFLIKPNEEELADLIGEEKVNINQLPEVLEQSIFSEIPWIVVTLGSEGAIVKFESNYYRAKIPTVDAVNPVGSGDSVIAGFSVGIAREMDEESIIKYGMTMGILNALEDQTGSINPNNINKIFEEITLEKI